jgi:glutamate-1-semialdehyde aminotransferase
MPDIATFAKALCAGEKLGAIVGSQDVMAVLDPRRGRDHPGIFQSGTTNDGTDALAAAMGSLQVYKKIAEDDGFNQLAQRTTKMVKNMLECFSAHGVPCHINQLGPMLQLFFTDPAQPNFGAYSRVDTRPVSLFTLALLAEGVLFGLPGSTHVYISFCHTDQDFERIIQGTDNVLRRHDFASLVAAANEK